jgi:hypothetical protein
VGCCDYRDMVFVSGVRFTQIRDFHLTEKELPGRRSGRTDYRDSAKIQGGEGLRSLILAFHRYGLSRRAPVRLPFSSIVLRFITTHSISSGTCFGLPNVAVVLTIFGSYNTMSALIPSVKMPLPASPESYVGKDFL